METKVNIIIIIIIIIIIVGLKEADKGQNNNTTGKLRYFFNILLLSFGLLHWFELRVVSSH